MAKALITSDTHGLKKKVAKMAAFDSFDIQFHCGDFCVDEDQPPFTDMHLVKGNNDFGSSAPLTRVIEWEGLRFFLTHGHTYNVNATMMNLHYKAQEIGADVVLFGHTHYPLCKENEGIIYVNPGSLKKPRGFKVPTFAVLKVAEKKKGKVLRFSYYDHKGKPVRELNRKFIR